MSITLAESLAMAVLKGDTAAAYALADQLIEEREGFENLKQRAIATRTYPYATDGYSVYSWPEFRAFCDRLGVLWDLRTIDITISILEGARVEVQQRYAGSDIPTPPPEQP